jgi:cytochrome c oxidase cbb3-type subunit 3
VSKDTNRLLGHADEADGIEEYDNPLPDWWVGLFWLTIVWGIGYGLWYHMGGRSQEGFLASEMAAAEAQWPAQAAAEQAATAEFTVTPEAVAAGEGIFQQNCMVCHGPALEGGIGPSLVDDEWIHGGQSTDIIRTIMEGVPAMGMVPWRGILSPEQINQAAAFIVSKNSEATGRSLEDFTGAADAEDSGAPE